MRSKGLYTLFLFLLDLSLTLSQTPAFNFQKLGSEEGLNNANIFNIEQHENGILYFTTQNGIYTYDGYNFTTLEIDSLKSNALLNVSLKNKNEILLSIRDEGLSSFDLTTKKYRRLEKLGLKSNSSDRFIIRDNYAYLLTAGIRLTIVNLKTGEVKEDQFRAKQKLNLAFAMYQAKDGRILLGRSDGLYEVRNDVQLKLDYVSNTSVHSITETLDGKLVVGTSSKILILNKGRIESEIIPKYSRKISTYMPGGEKSIDKIVADKYNRIWFTSYPDENLYLYQNNTVYDIFETLDIPSTLITCLYKDRDENIWLGTFSDGAYLIENTFFNALNFSFNNKILSVNQVFIKNNIVVAATSNGLYGLNLTSNIVKTLSKPDEVFTEPINNLSYVNDILYYTKRNQMEMAASVYSDGKNNYRFKPVAAKLFYPLNSKQAVISDYYANILLTNIDGTKVLDTLISFPDYRISVDALLAKNDTLFAATNNGLVLYNFKTKKYHNIVKDELNYKINDLVILDGNLYAAHEAGLTNINTGKLIQKAGTLRLNGMKKIRSFKGQIWLATLDGVIVCDKDINPVFLLNKSSGLPSNSVNDISFSDNAVCISTARGIAIASLNEIQKINFRLSPVIINALSAEGSAVPLTEEIKLSSQQDNVKIDFTSPLFNKPNKQYFRYRIDNGEWIQLLNTSLSAFIPSGRHTLEIGASTDNIQWSENTKLTFIKEEKITESRWIYWIILIAGLILISIVSYFTVKRIKRNATRRLQEEQQVNLLKHQAMNALLSPHFIFNSLTSIQNYINTNNSLKASEYLAKFSRLIRMIIEKASQSEITLRDELSRLTYYLELEKERFKNKFDYRLAVDPELNPDEIKIPNMIVQPHVENCIIHGILPKMEHGTLTVTFKKENNGKIIIVVEDDGIGLIKAKEHAKTGHKSLGTSTIRNILEINSKLSGKKQDVTMTDKSTLNPPSNGTLIKIELEQ